MRVNPSWMELVPLVESWESLILLGSQPHWHTKRRLPASRTIKNQLFINHPVCSFVMAAQTDCNMGTQTHRQDESYDDRVESPACIQERGLRRDPPCPPPGLRLPASRSIRKEISVVSTTWPVVLLWWPQQTYKIAKFISQPGILIYFNLHKWFRSSDPLETNFKFYYVMLTIMLHPQIGTQID